MASPLRWMVTGTIAPDRWVAIVCWNAATLGVGWPSTAVMTSSVWSPACSALLPGSGVTSLFPRDAVLNLPGLSYSWELQKLVMMAARENSYAQAREFVLAATGVSVANRQTEMIVAAAAADAEEFARDRGQAPVPEHGRPVPLGISADGKG